MSSGRRDNIVVKKGADCVCETLKSKVDAGLGDLMFETTVKLKVAETVKLDIPLNIECHCDSHSSRTNNFQTSRRSSLTY